MMKILIVGAFPPPIGGITVHIKRLYASLRRLGHQVEVYDFRGNPDPDKPDGGYRSNKKILQRLLYYSGKKHPDTILHIHVSAMGRFRWIGPLLVILFRNYPKVITIHSGSFIENTTKSVMRGHIQRVLSAFDEVITVSKEQKDYLLEWGIPNHQIDIIPAFIYQQTTSEILPEKVDRLLEEKEILVLTSGYLTPLYNYDVLISAIEKLSADKFGFVFALYHQYDPDYEKRILDRLSHLKNVVLMRDLSPETYLELVNNCNVYVRTTLTDGDSVAVREALQLGKTVFASDVVQRPSACHLFSANNPDTLLKLFESEQLNMSGLEAIDESAGIEPILNVYMKAHAHFQSKR